MTARERALGWAVTAARPLLPVLGLLSPELGRAAAERRGVVARLRDWPAGREDGRPTVWLHGASAGELAGAAPVVDELRRRRDARLLVTYFSPSAEPVLPRLAPDHADVLPLDTPREVRRALTAVRPDALLFAKGDLWPNLTREADRLGVPLGLLNGTVRRGSSRLRPFARWLLRPAYGRLSRAGAVSADHADRLRRLGVPEGALAITGDAAFDWALRRVRRAGEDPDSPARRLERLRPRPGLRLVAGSTWREDEEALLRALADLGRTGRPPGGTGDAPPVHLVLVPHEPDAGALEAIRRRCREAFGTEPELWSEAADGARGAGGAERADDRGAPVPLVVDEVGILAELYAAADLAFVGGGYGDAGLHSVVEPAAAGIPVLFGPRSTRREARELAARGGGRAVEAAGLGAALDRLRRDPELRRRAGRAAGAYVESMAGAAAAGADLVLELLEEATGRP